MRGEAVSLLSLPAGPSAADITLNITIAAGSTITLGVACATPGTNMAKSANECGFNIQLQVDTASVTSEWVHGGVTRHETYPLLTQEAHGTSTIVPVRVMTDTSSVEVFVHGGRFVLSTDLKYDRCGGGACAVVASAAGSGGTVTVSGVAWGMARLNVHNFIS